MLEILGSQKRLCNGITRRDLLHVGGISALGLSLNNPPRIRGRPLPPWRGDQPKPKRASSSSCLDRHPNTKRLIPNRSPPPEFKER